MMFSFLKTLMEPLERSGSRLCRFVS